MIKTKTAPFVLDPDNPSIPCPRAIFMTSHSMHISISISNKKIKIKIKIKIKHQDTKKRTTHKPRRPALFVSDHIYHALAKCFR